MDSSPPGSSVHGISQARILEWVAISFSRESPDPGIKPASPALQVDSLPWATREALLKADAAAAAAAKSLQSCPTLCDPIDGSQPSSPVPGILQARTLEWVSISFSNAWKWKVKLKLLSGVWLFATPWTAGYQAPLPMGFSRQEYWSWVPLPSLLKAHKPEQSHTVCKAVGRTQENHGIEYHLWQGDKESKLWGEGKWEHLGLVICC